MKAHLTKVSLALLSTVFLLGCQEQGSGPVGPDSEVGGPNFTNQKKNPKPHGNGDDDGAGGTVDLFLSPGPEGTGYTCAGGAEITTTMVGQVTWENVRRQASHIHAIVQLTGVGDGLYLIKGNQDTDGLCTEAGSITRSSHSTSVTVAGGSGETRIGFTFGLENEDGTIKNDDGHAAGTHHVWLTMTGPGGVFRTVAFEVVLKAHKKGH